MTNLQGIFNPTDYNDKAINSFTTYSNYVRAFELCCPVDKMQKAQLNLAKVKAIKGTPKKNRQTIVTALKPHLFRGALSLDAMKAIPVKETPMLALTANLWIPVQAYYALHGFGIATLIAMGATTPTNHDSFCAAIADQIIKPLFPKPLGICCSGNTSNDTCQFHGWDGDLQFIKDLISLTSPSNTDPVLFAAKAIYTTRKQKLEKRFKEARKKNVKPNRKYRQVKPREKEDIVKKLAPTSIVNFFYRLRERSNYDDPDLFLYGQLSEETAKQHYLSVVSVTNCIIQLFANIILKKIGKEEWEEIKNDFKKATHRKLN